MSGFGHRVYKNYDPRAKVTEWDFNWCSLSPPNVYCVETP
jgi:hypothetical protein